TEGADRSLEEYLEPPDIAMPAIDWSDEPEDIVDRKLGPLWRLDSERVIERFREQVERFRMDRLARRIEENGTELVARLEQALMRRVREQAAASPRGPERALELA